MTAKSVLLRLQGLRPRARALTCPPLATPLQHVSPTLLRIIYFSFVHPYLNYGITFLGNTASKYINKIQV